RRGRRGWWSGPAWPRGFSANGGPPGTGRPPASRRSPARSGAGSHRSCSSRTRARRSWATTSSRDMRPKSSNIIRPFRWKGPHPESRSGRAPVAGAERSRRRTDFALEDHTEVGGVVEPGQARERPGARRETKSNEEWHRIETATSPGPDTIFLTQERQFPRCVAWNRDQEGFMSRSSPLQLGHGLLTVPPAVTEGLLPPEEETFGRPRGTVRR